MSGRLTPDRRRRTSPAAGTRLLRAGRRRRRRHLRQRCSPARTRSSEFGPVDLVDLDDLPDDALIMPCGGIGAPTVSIEKLGVGARGRVAARRPGARSRGGRWSPLMAAEIGGANGIHPINWAARIGLPVVDADGMGRAFPEVPQVTMEIAGDRAVAVRDDRRARQPRGHPRHRRRTGWSGWRAPLAVEFGGTRLVRRIPDDGRPGPRRRPSAARSRWPCGSARALEAPDDPVRALGEAIGAVAAAPRQADRRRAPRDGRLRPRLGDRGGAGRRTAAGCCAGDPEREPGRPRGRPRAGDGAGHHHRARRGDRPTRSTPSGSATASGSSVVAFPCDPIWRTPAGLALAGPRAFGYDFDYVPVEQLSA